ncbi:MAG TPA: hypothetical protein VF405_08455, partial [Gammaproteobacteria bacterium]
MTGRFRALWIGFVAGVALAAGALAQPAPAPGSIEDVRRLLDGGKYADAEREARAALGAMDAAGTGAAAPAADMLDALVAALWRGGKAADPAAPALAERAIEIREKLLGPGAPALATSLDNAGV